ncbi:glycosyltransferase [Cyanobium sp. AMD-g]|uniref:glycosyltransferase family 2 protein n=1 Tax=Cyanobium sp. AMD-g TaxID=2823699 RepID=UPI0020CBAC09|nr:glycosyltransferase family 2 protein [Cyanobium sp. AMD-g]MCP9931025.1 glycosyltransferase [Cyanobium sp. AMD-g]
MTSFTYVTVVLNNLETISRCIDSILLQKEHSEVQYVVLDGGSSDGTYEVIERYAQRIDIIKRERDDGIYYAMNKCLEWATGDYICFVNADDWLHPSATTEANRIITTQSPKPDILAAAANVQSDWSESHWTPAKVDRLSVFRCPNLCHNSLFVSRRAYERVGVYNTRFRIAADSEWVIRAYAAGCTFQYTDKTTVYFTLGGTSSNLRIHAQEVRETASLYYPRLSPAIVDHLVYYFLSWQERRAFILPYPFMPRWRVFMSASLTYPGLLFPIVRSALKHNLRRLVLYVNKNVTIKLKQTALLNR